MATIEQDRRLFESSRFIDPVNIDMESIGTGGGEASDADFVELNEITSGGVEIQNTAQNDQSTSFVGNSITKIELLIEDERDTIVQDVIQSQKESEQEEIKILVHTKELPRLPSLDSGVCSDSNDDFSEFKKIIDSSIDEPMNFPPRIDSLGLSIDIDSEPESLKKVTKSSKLSKAEEEQFRITHNGKRMFNASPSDGIKYLIENGRLKSSPAVIAEFLFDDNGMLNKRCIGEFLGELSNVPILECYVQKFIFSDLSLEQALRQFLKAFRLPGEAQKIDRMMESFAKRFIECNPTNDIFKDEDTAYIMAFSLIMLNTDLHNPAVKNKIKKDFFVRNNLDILLKHDDGENSSKDIPSELLADMYESIAARPFDMVGSESQEENLAFFTFFNPEREGWLQKQGGRIKTWKKRFCIVTGSCLYYFKNAITSEQISGKKKSQQPCGIIPLENLSVEVIEPSDIPGGAISSKKFYFRIFAKLENKNKIKAAKTGSDGKIVEGKHLEYIFAADSVEERMDWMHSIEGQMAVSPVYALYAKKKKKKVADLLEKP